MSSGMKRSLESGQEENGGAGGKHLKPEKVSQNYYHKS